MIQSAEDFLILPMKEPCKQGDGGAQGVQWASGVPLFSFCGVKTPSGEICNLHPSPVLPKETGGHAHVFFSRFLKVSQPFTKPTREFHTRPLGTRQHRQDSISSQNSYYLSVPPSIQLAANTCLNSCSQVLIFTTNSS